MPAKIGHPNLPSTLKSVLEVCSRASYKPYKRRNPSLGYQSSDTAEIKLVGLCSKLSVNFLDALVAALVFTPQLSNKHISLSEK